MTKSNDEDIYHDGKTTLAQELCCKLVMICRQQGSNIQHILCGCFNSESRQQSGKELTIQQVATTAVPGFLSQIRCQVARVQRILKKSPRRKTLNKIQVMVMKEKVNHKLSYPPF